MAKDWIYFSDTKHKDMKVQMLWRPADNNEPYFFDQYGFGVGRVEYKGGKKCFCAFLCRRNDWRNGMVAQGGDMRCLEDAYADLAPTVIASGKPFGFYLGMPDRRYRNRISDLDALLEAARRFHLL